MIGKDTDTQAVPSGHAPAAAASGAATWSSLAALAGGHFAVDCCTGVWPIYKTLAHLDLATAGLIATAGAMVGNGLQVLFGVLADRGQRKRLLVGGVCLAGAVLLVPRTDSYAVMFALVLTTYVGAAAFHPAGTGAAGSLSVQRTGAFVGAFLAAGYAGFGLSQVVFASLYAFSPSWTTVLLAFPFATALLLSRRLSEQPARGQRAIGHDVRSLGRLARPLAPLFFVQVFATAINLGVIFLLPDLLRARQAAAWISGGGGHLALVLGAALSLLPAGHAADRWGPRRVLVAANVATAALLAALLLRSDASVVDLFLVAAFGAANGANNVVTVAEGNRRLPGRASVVSALMMGAPWCLAAIAPALAGSLADPARGGTPARAVAWIGLSVPATLLVSFWTPSLSSAGARAGQGPGRVLR